MPFPSMTINPRNFKASASALGLALGLALKPPAALNSTFLLVIDSGGAAPICFWGKQRGVILLRSAREGQGR
jgi:hypothetical protein